MTQPVNLLKAALSSIFTREAGALSAPASYGPILEVIALPDSLITPIFSYPYEHGFFKHSASKSDLDYRYSTMKIQQLRFLLALAVGKFQQLVLGTAGQDIQHENFYKFDKDEDLYRRRGKTQEKSRAYFAGFRLATF